MWFVTPNKLGGGTNRDCCRLPPSWERVSTIEKPESTKYAIALSNFGLRRMKSRTRRFVRACSTSRELTKILRICWSEFCLRDDRREAIGVLLRAGPSFHKR